MDKRLPGSTCRGLCKAWIYPGVFQKVSGKNNRGVVMYQYYLFDQDAESERKLGAVDGRGKEHVLILQNTSNVDIAIDIIAKDIYNSKCECSFCFDIMRHTCEMMKQLNIIKKHEIHGICDHCRMHHNRYCSKCTRCNEAIRSFMNRKALSQEEEHASRLQTWFRKVHDLLNTIFHQGRKIPGRATCGRICSDTQLNELLELLKSPRTYREPDVKELLSGNIRRVHSLKHIGEGIGSPRYGDLVRAKTDLDYVEGAKNMSKTDIGNREDYKVRRTKTSQDILNLEESAAKSKKNREYSQSKTDTKGSGSPKQKKGPKTTDTGDLKNLVKSKKGGSASDMDIKSKAARSKVHNKTETESSGSPKRKKDLKDSRQLAKSKQGELAGDIVKKSKIGKSKDTEDISTNDIVKKSKLGKSKESGDTSTNDIAKKSKLGKSKETDNKSTNDELKKSKLGKSKETDNISTNDVLKKSKLGKSKETDNISTNDVLKKSQLGKTKETDMYNTEKDGDSGKKSRDDEKGKGKLKGKDLETAELSRGKEKSKQKDDEEKSPKQKKQDDKSAKGTEKEDDALFKMMKASKEQKALKEQKAKEIKAAQEQALKDKKRENLLSTPVQVTEGTPAKKLPVEATRSQILLFQAKAAEQRNLIANAGQKHKARSKISTFNEDIARKLSINKLPEVGQIYSSLKDLTILSTPRTEHGSKKNILDKKISREDKLKVPSRGLMEELAPSSLQYSLGPDRKKDKGETKKTVVFGAGDDLSADYAFERSEAQEYDGGKMILGSKVCKFNPVFMEKQNEEQEPLLFKVIKLDETKYFSSTMMVSGAVGGGDTLPHVKQVQINDTRSQREIKEGAAKTVGIKAIFLIPYIPSR